MKITISTKATLGIEAGVFATLGALLLIFKSITAVFNIVLGVVFVAMALTVIIPMIINGRTILSGSGIMALVYLSVGLLCFFGKFIPIEKLFLAFLIVGGAGIAIDGMVSASKRKWRGAINWIEAVIGVVSLTAGILLWNGILSKFLAYIMAAYFLILAAIIIVNLIKIREKKSK